MEKLIESVRKFSCLWKLDSEGYKNNELKEEAWRQIIVECNITDVKEAKSLWKKLRDGHRQALNKKKTSTGQAACSSDTRVWKYENQMAFLLPHLSNRQRSTNAFVTKHQNLDITPQSNDNIQVEVEDEESVPIAEIPQVIYSINTPRHKRKSDKLLEYLEQEQKRRDTKSKARDQFRQELLLSSKPDETALKKFFDSMCDETSALPEYLKIKVQRQVFNIVMEAREKQIEDTQRRPVTVANSQYTSLNRITPPLSISPALSQDDASTSNEEYSWQNRKNTDELTYTNM